MGANLSSYFHITTNPSPIYQKTRRTTQGLNCVESNKNSEIFPKKGKGGEKEEREKKKE